IVTGTGRRCHRPRRDLVAHSLESREEGTACERCPEAANRRGPSARRCVCCRRWVGHVQTAQVKENFLITPRVTHDVEHYPIRILNKEAPDSPRLGGQRVDDLASTGDRL